MSKQVQVSQKLLFLLAGMLLTSLVAVGFLLGRQSRQATPSPTPVASAPQGLPTPVPLAPQAEQSLSRRVDALQGRVGTLQQRTVTPPPQVANEASKEDPLAAAELKARRSYFQQIDSILGSSALASPQPFATRLLEQGMSGGNSQLESVLSKTRQALSDVETVEAPTACREHKALLLGQLSHAIDVLSQVRTATLSQDPSTLNALPLPKEAVMSEALRLQKLDASLRPL